MDERTATDSVRRVNAPDDLIGRVSLVLRTVSGLEPHGGTTTAVARISQIARPTTHRILNSLRREGLIDRDDVTGHWSLGPEVYILGVTVQERYDLTREAQPYLRRLAQITGDSAFFSARRGEETVVLLSEEGSFPIRSHVLHEGARFPLGVASAGLALLAHLQDDEIAAYLHRADLASPHGPAHQPEVIRGRVDEVRIKGWSLNPGLIVEGNWGMAAAVFDHHQRPRWALTLTGIERRFGPERQMELGALLLNAAHRLGRDIGRRQKS
jgi:DNA-binding IclR family transcriptional regulator